MELVASVADAVVRTSCGHIISPQNIWKFPGLQLDHSIELVAAALAQDKDMSPGRDIFESTEGSLGAVVVLLDEGAALNLAGLASVYKKMHNKHTAITLVGTEDRIFIQGQHIQAREPNSSGGRVEASSSAVSMLSQATVWATAAKKNSVAATPTTTSMGSPAVQLAPTLKSRSTSVVTSLTPPSVTTLNISGTMRAARDDGLALGVTDLTNLVSNMHKEQASTIKSLLERYSQACRGARKKGQELDLVTDLLNSLGTCPSG